jgi:hypothetical protein
MQIVCWDKHGDEFKRLYRYLEYINIQLLNYQSEREPPPSDIADIFIVHEGHWIYNIPPDIRAKCILAPCIRLRQQDVSSFKNFGIKYAICKTANQAEIWGDGSVIVNTICKPEPIHNLSNRDKIVSLIHNWKERDSESFALALQIKNLQKYGEGADQLGHIRDIDILNESKFLVHIKKIGYVCNCVIKAISLGVPVITTPDTIYQGYEEILIHNQTALICNDIEEINFAINLSDDRYQQLQNGCLQLREKLTQPDPEQTDNLKKLIELILS